MSFPVLRSCLFFIFGLFLLFFPASAQKNSIFLSDSSDLFNLVQREYGPDQVLINGLYPEITSWTPLDTHFFRIQSFIPDMSFFTTGNLMMCISSTIFLTRILLYPNRIMKTIHFVLFLRIHSFLSLK